MLVSTCYLEMALYIFGVEKEMGDFARGMYNLRKQVLSPIKEEESFSDISWDSFSQSFVYSLNEELDRLEAENREFTIMVGGKVVKTLLTPNQYLEIEERNKMVANQQGLHCLYCGMMYGAEHEIGELCACHGCFMCSTVEGRDIKRELVEACEDSPHSTSLDVVSTTEDVCNTSDSVQCIEGLDISTPNVRSLRSRQ